MVLWIPAREVVIDGGMGSGVLTVNHSIHVVYEEFATRAALTLRAARTPRGRQRPVPVRPAHQNAKLGPAHRHPRTPPRTRTRRRRARSARQGRPTIRARSSRRRWRTSSRTRWRPPTRGRTCSIVDGNSWTIGPSIWRAQAGESGTAVRARAASPPRSRHGSVQRPRCGKASRSAGGPSAEAGVGPALEPAHGTTGGHDAYTRNCALNSA